MSRVSPVLTFGFEIEAILDPLKCGIETQVDYSNLTIPEIIENHYADQREIILPDEAKKVIFYLKESFGGKAVTDSSVVADIEGHFPFEFASSPEELSTDMLERLKDKLIVLTDNGVYANETCGFHVHFSFDGITKFDLMWIKLFYLFDIRSEKFNTFLSSAGEIGLWSDQYANQGNVKARRSEFHQIVEHMNDESETPEFVALFNEFFGQPYFSSKYTVFGIHDKYRTLEWRGPRGFLNTNNPDDIIRFIDLLRDFAEWLSFASYQGSLMVSGQKVRREPFRRLFYKIAQPQFIHFGIDIAEAVDAALTEEDRVEAMISYFRDIDLASRHSTNIRKISNRIKTRYPNAWRLMEEQLELEKVNTQSPE